MDFINRAKNIIVSPQAEWLVISTEQPNRNHIINRYLLPLAALGALAIFIGFWLFLRFDVTTAFLLGLLYLATIVLTIYLSALAIDALAPSFGSQKNLGRTLQLVTYSATPFLVGALLSIYPPLATIGYLFGLYGVYIFYLGLPILKGTPADKLVGFLVVSVLIIIIIYMVINRLLGSILANMFRSNRYNYY